VRANDELKTADDALLTVTAAAVPVLRVGRDVGCGSGGGILYVASNVAGIIAISETGGKCLGGGSVARSADEQSSAAQSAPNIRSTPFR
jgi:hypothetical protein